MSESVAITLFVHIAEDQGCSRMNALPLAYCLQASLQMKFNAGRHVVVSSPPGSDGSQTPSMVDSSEVS